MLPRAILLALATPLLVQTIAQTHSKPPTMPADRTDDTYAVYSAVITNLKLSHPDNNKKYLIVNFTDDRSEKALAQCLKPAEDQGSFEELLADYSQHHSESFQLERKFTSSKPYELLDAGEVRQFEEMTVSPNLLGGSRDDVVKFKGGTDLIRLGNVYFNRKRTLAAVHTGAFCGGLCGFWIWQELEKTENGRWEVKPEAKAGWGCGTIARVPAPIIRSAPARIPALAGAGPDSAAMVRN